MHTIVALLLLGLMTLLTPVQAAEIQIGSMDDMAFGQVPPTAGELEATSSYCIALDPRGRYQVVGLGDGAGGAFELSGGGSANLAYRVFVTDRGRRLGTELEPGRPLPGLRGRPPRGNGVCRRPFGQITVRIEAATLLQARPGRYRGTLNLTVAPE